MTNEKIDILFVCWLDALYRYLTEKGYHAHHGMETLQAYQITGRLITNFYDKKSRVFVKYYKGDKGSMCLDFAVLDQKGTVVAEHDIDLNEVCFLTEADIDRMLDKLQ